MSVAPGGLGRIKPPDFDHVSRYPLSAIGGASKPSPVQLGIAWMTNFDDPVKDSNGVYWIGKGDLGTERGGHAICAQPPSLIDSAENVKFYNQGQTPECVGYSGCRGQSLERLGQLFNPHWLYHAAQRVEGRLGEEGATVRAMLHVLLHKGIRPWEQPGEIAIAVSAYRWATKWDEVRAALGLTDDEDGVPLDQSWGEEGYPPHVRLTDEAGEWLLQHEGEAGLFTEK